MTDDLQEDEDRVLGDDKQETERSVTSNRDSEDVPRSLLSPVPKLLTQSHTTTYSISEIGRYSCRYQQTEMVILCHSFLSKESLSQKRVILSHIPHSSTENTSIIGRYSCRHNKEKWYCYRVAVVNTIFIHYQVLLNKESLKRVILSQQDKTLLLTRR